MQNSVVCDVEPFLKVGLLRWMASPSPFGSGHRLGVIRRDSAELRPTPGDNVVRLDPYRDEDDDLRSLDPDLHARMRSMACSTGPLSARDAFRALPANTVFFDEALTFDDLVRDDDAHRVVGRQRWFHEAMVAVTPCSLVFLDVDATPEEIGLLLDRGQSVVTHQLVEAPAEPTELERWVDGLISAVHDRYQEGPTVVAHHEGSSVRLFTLIPHRRHRADLNARLGALQMSRWGDELRLLRWHPALVGT